jgi:hypothetical protein
MNHPVQTLASGFGPPSEAGPSLTVVHSAAAWERVRKAYDTLQKPGVAKDVNWKRHVLMLVRSAVQGGHDVKPTVTRVAREGGRVEIRVEDRLLPDAQGLDVEAQPWALARTAVEAFQGDPEIALIYKGQPAAAVRHER